MTPWSTEVTIEVSDPISVRITAMLSLDPGPVREFRPLLTFELDEAHANELLGKLALGLHRIRLARGDVS